MEKWMDDMMPIMGVEHDLIVSKQGDVTLVYKAELPEIFTLSDQDYEAFHQNWVKAIKVLPKFTVFHKQDWFLDKKFDPEFDKTESKEHSSFLNHASNRFFNERPYLDHSCYIYLTQKPQGRKLSSSVFSNLLRPSIVPDQTVKEGALQDFLDSCGQFKRILEDSGFVMLKRIGSAELVSQSRKIGLIERYCSLAENENDLLVKDIRFDDGIQVGPQHVQIYTLGDAADLPALCGSRINYDRYSSDRTKFSVGFASTLGQLLGCSHIYNQFIFIEDASKTIQKLETKRLRLQSLSAYSRENLISRDSTNDFLNEAISEGRLPVRAHFNIMVWTSNKDELKDLKNLVSSGLAQMDAVAKMETAGAPQIFWAGIPGNGAGFPSNDCFDTFLEQSTCFLNLETSYRSSVSPFGLRLGDRQTGRPVHVDLSDEPMRRGWITSRNRFILGPSGAYRVIFN
ncbi:TraG family conjugative transposon ATPase [Chitinophaga sp. CC14]